MMNVVLGKNIQKAFTQKVNEYLEQGMVYNLASMSGHQGEIAKIDVTDGQDVYRINLTNDSYKSDYKDPDAFYGTIVVLTVEKFAGAVKGNGNTIRDHFNTLWTGKGEQVYEKVWYQIADRRDTEAYVESLDDAKACFKIKRSRNDSRDYYYGWIKKSIKLRTEEDLTAVRDMCREFRGYARVKRCHIKELVKYTHMNGEISYKVIFTPECGKNALIIKKVNVNR